MGSRYQFSCSAMPIINGHKLDIVKPDENGFYDLCIGCIGAPTRRGVIYEPESLIKAMENPNGGFNIGLRDGNLIGEAGHPVVEKKGPDGKSYYDFARLFELDPKCESHYFASVYIPEDVFMIDGKETQIIRAKLKPSGPYADALLRSIQDPCHNTAFSIRSLCDEMGMKDGYQYRKVIHVVTFDSVPIPGITSATKRYANRAAIESMEIPVNMDELERTIAGNESITDFDKNRIMTKDEFYEYSSIRTKTKTGYVDYKGNFHAYVSSIYRR